MRRLTAPVALALLTAVTVAAAVAAPGRHGTRPAVHAAKSPAAQARAMTLVGRLALGAERTNADVWVHRGHAYVGDWDSARPAEGKYCTAGPNDGVAVVDVRRPARPRRVALLAIPPGTWAEDVVVYTARGGPLAGRHVAVAGIQLCGVPRTDEAAFRGMVLWDVTEPGRPRELGRLDTGCCTLGVHSLEVRHRADLGRTFVYAAVPYSERPDDGSPTGRRDRAGRGDFRLVDVTDPAAPVEVSTWGYVSAGAGEPAPRGCTPIEFGHAAEPSDDGRRVFVSYWDAGFVSLNVSDPARPAYLGRTSYPAAADGDGHSATYDDARRLLFTADEDFCGGRSRPGYGFLRVYDVSRPDAPRQLATFQTARSRQAPQGIFTIHNPLLVGTTVYTSWYGDGVRVVDVRDPRRPREVAFFVPPPGPGAVNAAVWGVVVDRTTGLVYASDMASGLWILRRTAR